LRWAGTALLALNLIHDAMFSMKTAKFASEVKRKICSLKFVIMLYYPRNHEGMYTTQIMAARRIIAFPVVGQEAQI